MKKSEFSFLLVLMCMMVNAQVPKSSNYQAISHNSTGSRSFEQSAKAENIVLPGNQSSVNSKQQKTESVKWEKVGWDYF